MNSWHPHDIVMLWHWHETAFSEYSFTPKAPTHHKSPRHLQKPNSTSAPKIGMPKFFFFGSNYLTLWFVQHVSAKYNMQLNEVKISILNAEKHWNYNRIRAIIYFYPQKKRQHQLQKIIIPQEIFSPIWSTALTIFSISSGQMSGQWVNPKYRRIHFPK